MKKNIIFLIGLMSSFMMGCSNDVGSVNKDLDNGAVPSVITSISSERKVEHKKPVANTLSMSYENVKGKETELVNVNKVSEFKNIENQHIEYAGYYRSGSWQMQFSLYTEPYEDDPNAVGLIMMKDIDEEMDRNISYETVYLADREDIDIDGVDEFDEVYMFDFWNYTEPTYLGFTKNPGYIACTWIAEGQVVDEFWILEYYTYYEDVNGVKTYKYYGE